MEEHLWRRVEACYHAALEMPAAERAQFLAKEELEVRREVESLFLHEGDADEVLEQPVWKSLDRTTIVLHQGVLMGDYRIAGKLGSGGMGEVYRATDTKLHREVALKMLAPDFAQDAAWLSRFRREARVLASLNHPNIAAVYGLEEADGALAIAMELVEGPTLAERISRGRIIPVPEALNIARQIAEALEYAHENGIIHRDLKPANVKLRADGVVKVLDFGLAKAVRSTDKEAVTATGEGVILGTPAYMSPEQATGQAVDRRADIWAFGVLLFEMLSGRQIYARKTTLETLAAIARDQPDWEELPAGTPVPIRTLLHRCLDRNIKNRLRDIGEARVAIEAGGTEVPQPAQARHTWLAWIVAALASIGLAVVSSMHFGAKPTAPATPVRIQFEGPEEGGAGVLSPDGRHLAWPSKGRLWVRSLDSGETRDLTSATLMVPFWSRDSRYIAYIAPGKLMKIDVSGGHPEIVTDFPGSWGGGAWNADDVIVYSSILAGLLRVPAQGGVPVQLTSLDPARQELTHFGVSFLPDGRHFLYTRTSADPAKSAIYVGSVDSRPEQQSSKPLVASNWNPVYANSGQLLFVRDGVLMGQQFDSLRFELHGQPTPITERLRDGNTGRGGWAAFSVSDNGLMTYQQRQAPELQPTWFDRSGKILTTVGEPGDYSQLALSPDGTRLALVKRIGQASNIWLMDLARNTNTPFTVTSANDAFPVWSPEGSLIVFSSNRDGAHRLYQKPSNGARDEEVLLDASDLRGATSWSRDGKLLLFTTFQPKTLFDIWALRMERDGKRIPCLVTEFNEQQARFSPDGRWVAYRSEESGRSEIAVRELAMNSAGTAAEVGGRWQISDEEATEPHWRDDGRELYYRSRTGRVMAVEIATTPSFRAGKPKALGIVAAWRGAGGWVSSADGQRFLLLVDRSVPEPPTIILNWQAALKK